MSFSLVSEAKTLLLQLKNAEEGSSSGWHADCRRALSEISEAFYDDESASAEGVFLEKLRQLIANVELILEALTGKKPTSAAIGVAPPSNVNCRVCSICSAAKDVIVEMSSDGEDDEENLVEVGDNEVVEVGVEGRLQLMADDTSTNAIVVETVADGDEDEEVSASLPTNGSNDEPIHEASDEVIAEYEEVLPGLYDELATDNDPIDWSDDESDAGEIDPRKQEPKKRRKKGGTTFTAKPKGKMKSEYKYQKLPASSRKRKASNARKRRSLPLALMPISLAMTLSRYHSRINAGSSHFFICKYCTHLHQRTGEGRMVLCHKL